MPKRLTAADFRQAAASKGGQWLGDPIDLPRAHDRTQWQCAAGHVFENRYFNVTHAGWCPECRGKRGQHNGFYWTPADDAALKRLWCLLPQSRVAAHLNRSREAVANRAQALKLSGVRGRRDVMGITAFMRAAGVSRRKALALAEKYPHLIMTMYRGERPTTVFVVDAFIRWLKRPSSWNEIAVNRLRHEPFRQAVVGAYKELQTKGESHA